MRTIEITFTAKFRTTIQVDDDYDERDLLDEVDIPESDRTKYVEDSSEVCSVQQV